MERDFLISFLPRGAFLIWEPIMADRQVKRWLWRIQASPLADDCKISFRNCLSNSPTRDIYATSENTSDIKPEFYSAPNDYLNQLNKMNAAFGKK